MNRTKTTYVVLVIIVLTAFGIVFTANEDGGRQPDTPADKQSTTTADHFTNHTDSLAGTSTDYYPQKDDVTGYLSVPESTGADTPMPAVILVHEWWGLNKDIKQMADDFANQGYVALAVDLYGKPPTASSTVARKRSSQVRDDIDAAMANLQAAKTYLQERTDVDENRLASVGWCFGGDWAYRMAAENMGLAGTVMYYGQFKPQDDFANMRTSILGHFGEEDSVVNVDNAREFKASLEGADQESSVYIYPNVGHGFANYRGGDNLAYDRQKAERAWTRTLDFLQKQLDVDAQLQSSATSSTETGSDPTQPPNGTTSTVFLRFSVSEGHDVVVDGVQVGQELQIMFSGRYNLYEKTYRETDENRYTERSLVKSGFISESRLNGLRSLLTRSGFYNYPKQVPQFQGRPRIEGPADTVSVSARSDTQADLKKVNHKEGARGGAYPDGFENVEETLQKLMRKVVAKN